MKPLSLLLSFAAALLLAGHVNAQNCAGRSGGCSGSAGGVTVVVKVAAGCVGAQGSGCSGGGPRVGILARVRERRRDRRSVTVLVVSPSVQAPAAAPAVYPKK